VLLTPLVAVSVVEVAELTTTVSAPICMSFGKVRPERSVSTLIEKLVLSSELVSLARVVALLAPHRPKITPASPESAFLSMEREMLTGEY